MIEHLLRRELQSRLTRLRDQLQAHDRIAPRLEEVLRHPQLLRLAPQHRGPDRPHLRLARRARRHRLPCVIFLRCGQRPAVQLAVGHHRQPRELHPPARHHVPRQLRLQRRLQLRRLRLTHPVRHQPPAFALAAQRHHRLLHSGAAAQLHLDLAQLDPVTAQLHLLVQPTQVLDAAVRAQAAQVPAAVQPFSVVVRRRHEALRGQPRPSQVAARQRYPANAQLAQPAHRHFVAVPVQHAYAAPRIRNPDRCAHVLRVLRLCAAV
ncbi:hypothetical protein LMG24238_07750 [Paraburkholderia sediminicola]|uniref:Uncharacterized protein n=1 Tax=Paraburkholderia sediminicola TaxID=458836 RepID=A0A6J5CU14_9BURK|nr:hypothetical protein LMG24238_07750 [Paraburkholderia sediminicola]